MNTLRIFGLGGSRPFAQQVAKTASSWDVAEIFPTGTDPNTIWEFKRQNPDLGNGRLSFHAEERRPDGEAYTISLDNVRGCDVFVITSLYGDEDECVDEKLMKAAIFINTLRHASAARITLVCPYLCYMRQDRKLGSRAPIATQAVAMMLEAVGMDRLLTMDVHNLGAEQNAFRVPIDNLEARKLLADAIAEDMKKDYKVRKYKVLSPDAGGTARTKQMQASISKRFGDEVGIVYADKTRTGSSSVNVQIVGDVEGCNIIAIDDMISTGSTIAEVALAVNEAGGNMWGVAATHGLFVNGASEKMAGLPRIYVTDTVLPFRLPEGCRAKKKLRVVQTALMFAEAIRRIHNEGGSISELLED